jgi:Putative auto-transporter adhesin, head GIN domain
MMHRPARASLLVLLAGALAVSGCGSLGPGRAPSGTTATKRIDAAGVARLDVASGFDVRVSLGQPEVVTVTYDDHLADLLDVRVDGRTLRIQLQPNGNLDHHRPTLRAEVTMARLEELRAAGASTVTVGQQAPRLRSAAADLGQQPSCRRPGPGPGGGHGVRVLPAGAHRHGQCPQRPRLGGQQPRAGRSPP